MHSNGWMGMGYDGWAHDGWHGLFGFHGLITLIALAVIIFAIVALVRDWRTPTDAPSNHQQSNSTHAR